MMYFNLVTFVIFLHIFRTSECGNILALFPSAGKSHSFMFLPFANKLAERGHHLTVVTHFPPPQVQKNVTYIQLEGEIFFNSFPLEFVEAVHSYTEINDVWELITSGLDECDYVLQHLPIQQLIKSKKHFDLIIVEYFNTDCFAVFAHIFKAPLIGIFPSAMMPWHNDRFGNPDNPSYIVNHFLSYPSRMDLFQRVKNSLMTFGVKFVYRTFVNWMTDVTIQKHLGDGIPPINEIVKNTSVFLINTHFSIFQPRPLVPGIVEIGGLHVQPAKKLPSDLQKFLDQSKNGVIFFSLGSTARGSTMSEEKRKIFAAAFRKINMQVLWKWEDETMPDKPDNVLLGKWLPQNDILSHPNVKVFMTHTGLMGTEEAVYNGVPLLMLPLFGDQYLNAASCSEKGIGIVVDFFTLTEEKLDIALKSILENRSYSENAKRIAAIFNDRPVSAMDSAMYWTEYVIRYKGAPHLKSANVDLPWYSEYLLDVALVIALTLYLVYFVFKNFIKFFSKRKTKTKEKQN